MNDLKKILFAVLGTIILVMGLSYVMSMQGDAFSVPKDFTEQRLELINTAVQITTEINSSLDSISEIDSYQRAEDSSKTLSLIRKEIATDTTRKETALAFSEILGKLTILISQVEPLQAQEQLVVIAQQGMVIVRSLLDYNEQLATLFIQLETKVSANDPSVSDFLQTSVDVLNKSADTINAANDRFNELWRDFDSSF